MSAPNITVYFLNASRAIRIPWLLEELGLPYQVVTSPRSPEGVAPQSFKDQIPAPLKKSPTITDGDVVVQESGAIVEYLVDKYDANHDLLPEDPVVRATCREWLHAAEGTFMLHALAILYARWQLPDGAKEFLPEMEGRLARNVKNDFRWLEGVLEGNRQKGDQWIVAGTKRPSVADVMMGFCVEFITTRGLGVEVGGAEWPRTMEWWARVSGREEYRRAVERCGYTLESKGKFRT